jgi:hypothetical protein
MIEINGNEYPVRYSMKALKKFERKAKVNVFLNARRKSTCSAYPILQSSQPTLALSYALWA